MHVPPNFKSNEFVYLFALEATINLIRVKEAQYTATPKKIKSGFRTNKIEKEMKLKKSKSKMKNHQFTLIIDTQQIPILKWEED